MAHGASEVAVQCARGTLSYYTAAMYIVLRDHSESSAEDLVANLEGFAAISDKVDSLGERAMQAVLPGNVESLAYQKARSVTVVAGNTCNVLRSLWNGLGSMGRAGLDAAKNTEKAAAAAAKEIKRFHVSPASSQTKNHILDGHFGDGKPGKSLFPQHWTDKQTMANVNSLPNDRNVPWKLTHPSRSDPDTPRYLSEGIRDDVLLRVVFEKERGIITAYPIK